MGFDPIITQGSPKVFGLARPGCIAPNPANIRGPWNDRVERKKVMALAQAREIGAILVTELSRWGRSTQDLVQTLDDLHSWKVSVLAQTGLSFDLSTASGKLMRTIMAGLAEFERDLIRDRVKSGLAAARARRHRPGPSGRSAPIRQKGEEGACAAQAGPLIPSHWPQPWPLQEHRDGDRQAGGWLIAARANRARRHLFCKAEVRIGAR